MFFCLHLQPVYYCKHIISLTSSEGKSSYSAYFKKKHYTYNQSYIYRIFGSSTYITSHLRVYIPVYYALSSSRMLLCKNIQKNRSVHIFLNMSFNPPEKSNRISSSTSTSSTVTDSIAPPSSCSSDFQLPQMKLLPQAQQIRQKLNCDIFKNHDYLYGQLLNWNISKSIQNFVMKLFQRLGQESNLNFTFSHLVYLSVWCHPAGREVA